MSSSASFEKPARRMVARHHRRTSGIGDTERSAGSLSGLLEVVALVAIALLLVFAAMSTSGTRVASPPFSQLKVRDGDSLWTLAVSHPVDGLTTAQVVELLAQTNHLDGGHIAAGDTILVPPASLDRMLAAR